MPLQLSPDPALSIDPWENLETLVDALKTAAIELKAASEEYSMEAGRNADLCEDAIEEEIAMQSETASFCASERRRYREAELSKRPEFVRSCRRNLNAQAKVHELRTELLTLQLLLTPLVTGDKQAEAALLQLDRVSLMPSLDSVQVIIGLVEQVLKARKRGVDPTRTERRGERHGAITPEGAAGSSREILTAREVEELVRLDVKTIYRYVQRGLMPYVRIQSNLRFNRSEILAWMEERRFRPLSKRRSKG